MPIKKMMLTVEEVAEILGISSRTVRRMIEKKEIPVKRFNTTVRIPLKWIEQMVEC